MKHITLISFFLLSALCFSRAQLITPPAAEKPAAQLAAESIIDSINVEIGHRVAVHKIAWETLWENEREGATPAAILQKLGTNAKLVFQFSAENLAHLNNSAAIVGKQLTTLVNSDGERLLPDKYLAPKFPIVFHADGTVTLQ